MCLHPDGGTVPGSFRPTWDVTGQRTVDHHPEEDGGDNHDGMMDELAIACTIQRFLKCEFVTILIPDIGS